MLIKRIHCDWANWTLSMSNTQKMKFGWSTKKSHYQCRNARGYLPGCDWFGMLRVELQPRLNLSVRFRCLLDRVQLLYTLLWSSNKNVFTRYIYTFYWLIMFNSIDSGDCCHICFANSFHWTFSFYTNRIIASYKICTVYR